MYDYIGFINLYCIVPVIVDLNPIGTIGEWQMTLTQWFNGLAAC
jgi:hypothetical protein